MSPGRCEEIDVAMRVSETHFQRPDQPIHSQGVRVAGAQAAACRLTGGESAPDAEESGWTGPKGDRRSVTDPGGGSLWLAELHSATPFLCTRRFKAPHTTAYGIFFSGPCRTRRQLDLLSRSPRQKRYFRRWLQSVSFSSSSDCPGQ